MDPNNNSTTNDFQITDQIEDTISQMKFIPSKNNLYLATCGWDCKIRVWNVQYNMPSNQITSNTVAIQSSFIYTTDFPDPLLSLAWQGEQTNLFTGCADGTVNYIDLQSNQKITVGKHETGCKELIWNQNFNLLMSGGWDGKLHFWDMRQQNPAWSYDFGKKIFTMSMTYPLLVVGLSDRIVSYFNMNKLSGTNFGPDATFESHLKHQTRKIATFPEGDGYAIGSIEGRVAIKHIDLNKAPEINQETKTTTHKDDFAFRCHRTGEGQSEVYAVNDIAFNPVYGTFCTSGGDGSWIIWDKDSRSRLRAGFHQNRAPITAIDYSGNGDLLAYACGYDWAKGVQYEKSFSPKINIHYCNDADKKKKMKK
jgi:mRNA export factor